MSVSSGDRRLLSARPKSRVSAKSRAYTADPSGAGPSVRKASMFSTVNGRMPPTFTSAGCGDVGADGQPESGRNSPTAGGVELHS